MRVTLLQRKANVDKEQFQSELDTAIRSVATALSATAKFSAFSKRGWTTINVEGDDSEVLVELLSRKFGLAVTDANKIESYGNYRGFIQDISSDLLVDVGIELPEAILVTVKSSSLLAQLADGKRSLPANYVADCYGMLPDLPISIRLSKPVTSATPLQGWLSDSQISLFSDWIRCGLERIQAFDCLPGQLSHAIREARLERDIVSTDHLSLTTHSLVCKIGTNAVGLIPRLGAILRRSRLVPFVPQRIEEECRVWRSSFVH
jgi:hypothetical protein